MSKLGRRLRKVAPLDVLVIYKHSLLWDILKTLLSDIPGIGIAAIERAKLDPKLLAELDFDAVIVDSDVLSANDGLAGMLGGALLGELNRPRPVVADEDELDDQNLQVVPASAGSTVPGRRRRAMKLIVTGLTSDELIVVHGARIANADAESLIKALTA